MKFYVAQCDNEAVKEKEVKNAMYSNSDIILFPELVSCNEKTYSLVAGSGYEEGDFFDRQFNRYSLNIGKTRILKYDKQNLFPEYDRGRIPGSEMPYVLLNDMKIYIAICYDIRFPYVFEQMENPDIIIIPADFPKERITDWRVLLQVRAMQNKCYIIGVNTPNGGNSMVIDPKGNIIKELGFGKGCMVFKIP